MQQDNDGTMQLIDSMTYWLPILGMGLIIVGLIVGGFLVGVGLRMRRSNLIQDPRTGAVYTDGAWIARLRGGAMARQGVLILVASVVVGAAIYALPYLVGQFPGT